MKCFKKVDKIKSCGRCRWMKYCSLECQRGDWENHKEYCEIVDYRPTVKKLQEFCKKLVQTSHNLIVEKDKEGYLLIEFESEKNISMKKNTLLNTLIKMN